MDRIFLVTAAIFGFLGIAGGAFGAHALSENVPKERVQTFDTASRYLVYGALSLFAVEWLRSAGPDTIAASAAGVCFIAGTIVFSLSLWLLVATDRTGWGAVTPLGGVLLLAGWGCVLWAALTAPLVFDFFR